jgi:hypothetical protein
VRQECPPKKDKVEKVEPEKTKRHTNRDIFRTLLMTYSLLSIASTPKDRDKRPHVDVKVGRKKISALVDTGATASVMEEKTFLSIEGHAQFKKFELPAGVQITGASGQELNLAGRFLIPVSILGISVERPFYVIKGLAGHRMIIGVDMIRELNLAITADDVQLQTVLPDMDIDAFPLFALKDFVVPARSVMRKKLFLQDVPGAPEEGSRVVVGANMKIPTVWEGIQDVGKEGSVWCVLANLLDEELHVSGSCALAVVDLVRAEDCRLASDEEVAAVTLSTLGDAPEPQGGDAEKKLSAEEEKDFRSKLQIKCHSQEWKDKYENLCVQFHDVFSKDKFDLGRCDVIKHSVKMKDDTPVHQRQFTIPIAHRQTIYDWVDSLLACGAIELSRSAYNSPIFLVPKPHGHGMRAVLDFREVNKNSLPDRYVIRDIKECIDEVGQSRSKVFSALDLTSGFWQQVIEEESRQYTAFTVPGKHTRFQWCVTPMGLQGSPASFARLIDYCVRGLVGVIAYIDDMLVHTTDHPSQVETLERVLLRLRKYNLKLNIGKTIIGASELEYLGFHLSGDGVGPGLEKLGAMRKFPEPDSIKKIREFLGMANYFRFMVKNFAMWSGELSGLLKKDAGYKKGPLPLAAANAFRHLKAALSSNPVVRHPTREGKWRLTTDASQGDPLHQGGLGAVLTQMQDGEECVIAYASRGLKKFEKNYSAYLLEMAAADWAIDYFNVYLAGRHFTLFTDHKPLCALSSIHKKTLNRLQQQLLAHDFEIEYKAGEENTVADALSRNPVMCLSDKSGSLAQAQDKDNFCSDLKKYVQTTELPQNTETYLKRIINMAKDCSIVNDVLYYFHRRDGMRSKMAVVTPESLWHRVTEAAHNSWHGGHGGVDRTKDRVFLQYYWPGVHNYVANYVKHCERCQITKGKHPPPSPLKSLPICDGRNERVHIDCFGPLKTSNEGNKLVLVMTDAFSKWVELAALPDKTAESVAKAFFEKWICRFSVPLVVVSDNGTEFCNQVLTKLFDLMGIQHNRTSPYHPQSNSSAESFNRSMKKYLNSMLENSETLNWESYLPMLQLSYNCHVHKSVLESPFYLTYNHDPRLPFFDMDNPRPMYAGDYAEAQFKAATAANQLVFKNQWDARLIREKYYNQKTKEREFHVGDRVIFYVNAVPKNVNAKFFKHWQGPYYVIKKISPLNYVIQKSPRSKELTVHVEKIKHIQERDLRVKFDSKIKMDKSVDSAEYTDLRSEKIDPSSGSFEDFKDADSAAEQLRDHDVLAHDQVLQRGAEPDLPDSARVITACDRPMTRSRVKDEGRILLSGKEKSRI